MYFLNPVLFYSYELDNGQIFSENGELKTIGDQQAVVKSGAYSFVSPDGVVHWVTYTADENGFHPVVGMFFSISQFVVVYAFFSSIFLT